MGDTSLRNSTALVTGASSGLGWHFAHQLAARGANLVLTARRTARLEQLAAELRTRCGVEVHVEPWDLRETGAGHALAERLGSRGLSIDILINNAGLTTYGPFLDIPWPRHANVLNVNVMALTELTHALVPAMVARGRGRVLLVGSVLGYFAAPDYASYSASKAYVRFLGDILAFELRGTGVTVSVLAPSSTATEFFEVAGQELSTFQRATMLQPEKVVRIGIRSMLKGKRHVTPGWLSWWQAHSPKFVPGGILKRIARWVLRK